MPAQISVASVSNPIGRRRSVAGSSLTVLRNTSAAPASRPDRASGRTTAAVAPSGLRPSERAASSSRGLTESSDARVEASAYGMKRSTYAKRSSPRLWYTNPPIRAPKNTSASATAIPGSALGESVSRSSKRASREG